jgi:hypothetical protein
VLLTGRERSGSLNWGYKVQLRDKSVTYKQEYAEFLDPHTVHARLGRRSALRIFHCESALHGALA